MSSDDDQGAPLYDALWSLSGMTSRHHLRETPVADYTPQQGWHEQPDPYADAYGLPAGHVYGSDDQPGGPPEPPLGEPEPADPYAPLEKTYPRAPLVPASKLIAQDGPVCCPTCGSGVHPSRIR